MNQTKLIRGWLNISSVTGLSRYKLKELIANGKFPPPQHLGYRTIVWHLHSNNGMGRKPAAGREQ